MKASDDIKEVYKSGGGMLAISILVILVLFAIFSSNKKAFKMSNNMTAGQLEDMREQRLEQQENMNKGQRNFIVKDGQNMVIF